MEILELKSTITEIKNSVGGLNSRIKETAERTSELEDETIEIAQFEQQRENRLGGKKSHRASGLVGL